MSLLRSRFAILIPTKHNAGRVRARRAGRRLGALDELEARDVPANPAIASVSLSATVVTRGTDLTLTGVGVADDGGAIDRVEFYRDANTNGTLEPGTDQYLGQDTSPSPDWSLAVSTLGFPLGSNRFFARVRDVDSTYSAAAASPLVNVTDSPPAIGSLTVSPGTVHQPGNITFTAANITDADGSAVSVQFYRDVNRNGTIDLGTDQLLGESPVSGGEAGLTLSTVDLPVGSNQILARAKDNDGAFSPTASSVAIVSARPAPYVRWDTRTLVRTAGFERVMSVSSAVDAGGNVHLSYVSTDGNLYYGLWDGVRFTAVPVDSGDISGGGSTSEFSTSIAVDSFGHPHIAYGGRALKYASFDGSSWSIQVVDTLGGQSNRSALFQRLVIDGNDRPHISYTLKEDFVFTYNLYVKYATASGGSWSSQLLSDAYGKQSAIALDGQGRPSIIYSDGDGNLTCNRWDGTAWSARTLVPFSGAERISAQYDQAGVLHVAFAGTFNSSRIFYGTLDGLVWSQEVVDATGAFEDVSLAIGPDGEPRLAFIRPVQNYWGSVFKPMFAEHTPSGWAVGELSVADLPYGGRGDLGSASLALDGQGVPHVSYFIDLYNSFGNGNEGSVLRLATGDRWAHVAADQTADFHWLPVAGADHYLVTVTDQSAGGWTVARSPDVTATTWSLDRSQALTPGHTYTWYVTPVGADGRAGPRGAGHTFSLPRLGAPVLVGPSGKVAVGPGFDAPTFRWYPVEGADHYVVSIVDLTGGRGQTGTAAGTTWVPGVPLSPGHRYSWRVQAVSTNGRGVTWSGPVNFNLAPLAAPPLLSVTGGAGDQPQFTWAGVVGADHYLLTLTDRTTGKVLVRNQQVTGTTVVPAVQLLAGHRYSWQVAAVSTNGLVKVWSLQTNFSVA